MIGNRWDDLLAEEWEKPYYRELREFLKGEYESWTVYPPAADIYNALRLTDYDNVRVVILGQDPYHEPGQAHGLAFSVQAGTPEPPSLVNIFRELRDDLGTEPSQIREGGLLDPWARHGVLLLNTVLTVREHEAGSHRGRGWERLTDRVIELLAERDRPMVFILWGSQAGAKRKLIQKAQADRPRHLIIRAPHPSPLSAYRGFFGGRYFSRCNYFLEDCGMEPVDWSL